MIVTRSNVYKFLVFIFFFFKIQVGGLFEVRFLTSTSGYYDVELTAGGSTHVMGRVYVAE